MTKNFAMKFFSVIALALLLGAGQAFTQGTVTGGINGRVADPQGAVVPNATITITNKGTNNVTTVTATENGDFRVTNLQPGAYRVESSSTGFAPAIADNVIVEVGQSTQVNFDLQIGE